MSKMQYRNFFKTKKQIQDAVVVLIDKKRDINLVSITDIIKIADISRSTFYNHYNNVVEVIEDIENVLMDKLTSTLEDTKRKNQDVSSFTSPITKFIKENEEIFKMIVPYIPQYMLDDMKKKFLNEFNKIYPFKENKNTQEVFMNIIANGIAGLYIDYFEGRINLSLDNLEQYVINFLETIINSSQLL